MNKAQIVKEISVLTGISCKKSNQVLDVIFKSITDELVAGNKVNISGFGHFETVIRAPKVGRNPKTGVEVKIPAVNKPVFKASGKLMKFVNI